MVLAFKWILSLGPAACRLRRLSGEGLAMRACTREYAKEVVSEVEVWWRVSSRSLPKRDSECDDSEPTSILVQDSVDGSFNTLFHLWAFHWIRHAIGKREILVGEVLH